MRGFVRSSDYKAIAAVLAKARRDAGITQRDLAKRVGVLPSIIAKIELGERRLDVFELVAIARAVSLDPHILLDKVLDAVPEEASP